MPSITTFLSQILIELFKVSLINYPGARYPTMYDLTDYFELFSLKIKNMKSNHVK